MRRHDLLCLLRPDDYRCAAAGLTQTEAARVLGVSVVAVNKGPPLA